jgi:hypothetical protein
MTAFAGRYDGQDVLVARAIPDAAPDGALRGIAIEAQRFGAQGPGDTFGVSVEAGVGETPEDVYARAADEVSERVQEDWKSRNLLQSGPAYRIAVSVPVRSLDDWLEVRRRLEGVPVVRSAEVQSLSRTEARLTLVYYGRLDQLALALNQHDLALRRGPVEWEIALGAGPLPDFSEQELNPQGPGAPGGADQGLSLDLGYTSGSSPGQVSVPSPILSPYVPQPLQDDASQAVPSQDQPIVGGAFDSLNALPGALDTISPLPGQSTE